MGKLIWKENGKTHVRNFSGMIHQDAFGRASSMDAERCKNITLMINTGDSHEQATPLEWIEGQPVMTLAGFSRIIDWVLGGVATIAILNIAAFIL